MKLSSILLLCVVCQTVNAQTIKRGPFLQIGTPTSVTIVWRTDSATDAKVEYGKTIGSWQSVTGSTQSTQHEIQISGLTPNTRYYYRVGTSAKVLAGGDNNHFFKTSPATGATTKFRFWVVGDSGTGGSAQKAVRDSMLTFTTNQRPDIYLHMGDMAYEDGTDSQFQTKFFDIYQSILRNTVVWPTLGNHEGHTSDGQAGKGPYFDAYVLPKAGQAGGLPSGAESYYAFNYANVHFVVLNSYDVSRSPTGPMLTWLKNDLAATKQPWIIAFWHHPPYSKGSHDSDTEGYLREMRENALPILEQAGVDLVLGGHSHTYERSYLIDGAYATPTKGDPQYFVDKGDGKPNGNGAYQKPAGLTPHNGAVYVVAGHGGTGVSAKGKHPVMYFQELYNGSCLVDIDNNKLTLINLRRDGQQSDTFTIIKGGSSPPPPPPPPPADSGVKPPVKDQGTSVPQKDSSVFPPKDAGIQDANNITPDQHIYVPGSDSVLSIPDATTGSNNSSVDTGSTSPDGQINTLEGGSGCNCQLDDTTPTSTSLLLLGFLVGTLRGTCSRASI